MSLFRGIILEIVAFHRVNVGEVAIVAHENPVVQLLVKAEARSLLKLLVATLEIAGVRMVLGMGVDVLCQVLLLSKVAAAHIANESLEAHVQRDQMSLEAEARAEIFATVGHGTDIGVLNAFVLLALNHLVENSSEVLLLLAGQLEVGRELILIVHRPAISILADTSSPMWLMLVGEVLDLGGKDICGHVTLELVLSLTLDHH